MQKNRIEVADDKAKSDIQYVYRYAVVAGRDVWKWQQKGTFVWATANTEREAVEQMTEDAAKRGSSASISDISLFRPRREQSRETPETGRQVQQPIEPDGMNITGLAATPKQGTEARTVQPDTENGVYRGTIMGETEQHILQRQSARTTVLHPKELLDRQPVTGENVTISYSNCRAVVKQTRSQAKAPEMGR